MNDDIVKVSAATLGIGNEGTTLKLHTVEGVEVNFLLDDLAMALVGLTSGLILQDLKARKERGEQPRVFKKEDANNG